MVRISKVMDGPRTEMAWAFRKTKMMWTDKKYLMILYHLFYVDKSNLNNYVKYSKKMQWLRLCHRRPLFTKMIDRFEVKNIVSEAIGAGHVVPCYGVWDSFDEIGFDKLTNQFERRAA